MMPSGPRTTRPRTTPLRTTPLRTTPLRTTRLRTTLLTAALGAAMLTGAVAAAQGAAAEAAAAAGADAAVYDLYQGPAQLGEVGVAVRSEGDGAASRSWVSIPGLLDLRDELVTAADGTARSYLLEGTAQGTAIRIEAAFAEAGVTLAIEQAGQRASIELATTEPTYVLDNNFLDGYQVVADTFVVDGAFAAGVVRTLPVVVPQAAVLGTLELHAAEAREQVEVRGVQESAWRLDATLRVGPQAIPMTLWLDDDGRILLLEQGAGAIRFVLRPPAGAGAADGASAAAATDRETADERLARDAACVVERELEVVSTGAVLAGRLTVPVASAEGRAAPAPVLVLLPGSGAVDVDGNAVPLLRNSGYRQLAYALACQGYATLRIAKLGIPPSTGDGNAVTIDTYVQNTADWVARLAQEAGVDAERLGLIGHSEGGLVVLASVAGGAVAPDVVVLIATAGRPFDVLIEEQLLARATEGGASAEQVDALRNQTRQAIAAIRTVEGTRLELSGALAENPVAAMFAHAAGLLRSEIALDPLALAARVAVPVVVVQGEKDLQVRPVDGRLLAEAAPRATLLAFPDLTHNLVDVAGPALGGLIPAYDAALSDTLLRALTTYLNGHLRTAR